MSATMTQPLSSGKFFANCVMTLYLLKVRLQTFLVANERYVHCVCVSCVLISLPRATRLILRYYGAREMKYVEHSSVLHEDQKFIYLK